MMDEIAHMDERNAFAGVLHEVRNLEEIFLKVKDISANMYHTHAQEGDVPYECSVTWQDLASCSPT